MQVVSGTETEYEHSFGLALRNDELSPYDPETPVPFNSPFWPGTLDGAQILTLVTKWVGRSKLGVPGHIHPEIKGQSLNRIFCFTRWRSLIILSCQLTGQQNKTNFAIYHFQKRMHLTIIPLSLGIYASNLSTCRPPVLRGIRICTPFRLPGPERKLKGSFVLGKEGDNSPFRGARPKIT